MKAFLQKNIVRNIICLVAALAVTAVTGYNFYTFRTYEEEIVAGEGVTETFMLSDYLPALKDTYGDTVVYVLKGQEEGGSMLVMGGTHADELAGHMAAITMVESGVVSKGTVYVIPRTNNSAFTNNYPQEATPQYIHLETQSGTRTFVMGSRATNPLDQWPDPDLYVHYSGDNTQSLSGNETRNLNRSYPGKADGNLTEQVAYAITTMIQTLDIDVTVDLHEASPEYPNINSIVAHEDAMNLATEAQFDLDFYNDLSIRLEQSPTTLLGLTHRELGDFTDTLALLMETANPCQGRIRGATTEELAIHGEDACYEKAYELGYLYIDYSSGSSELDERVGRHLQAIQEFANLYGTEDSEKIVLEGLPSYEELMSEEYSIGDWLK